MGMPSAWAMPTNTMPSVLMVPMAVPKMQAMALQSKKATSTMFRPDRYFSP